jgi:acyl-coenzyme A synthetase/AMP-(fatty) acid ligase
VERYRRRGVLYHGGTVHFAVRNEVDLINTAAVNYAIFLNGDADDIVKSGAARPGGHKVCIEVFGASVAPALRDRIRRQFKSGIWNTYASNETNVIAVLDDDNVGTLERGMEVRLVDEQGGDVAPGRTGRIRVRGDTMVDCYFNAPELTRACFIDGWFQTNDLGCQPAPGKLLLLGRIDNVLNIGGVKVPATPIEERIRQLAHISDAALLLIGNDHDLGMLLVAVETTTSDVAELEASIRAILAPCRTPSTVVMSRSLPRTRTGKIQRHEIEAAFREQSNGEFVARI